MFEIPDVIGDTLDGATLPRVTRLRSPKLRSTVHSSSIRAMSLGWEAANTLLVHCLFSEIPHTKMTKCSYSRFTALIKREDGGTGRVPPWDTLLAQQAEQIEDAGTAVAEATQGLRGLSSRFPLSRARFHARLPRIIFAFKSHV
jgi:hypothetical protein